LKYKSLDIDDLVGRCKKNDTRAQVEVYDRFQKSMYNSAYNILRNEADAEDAMQEGFITAFSKLAQYKREKQFAGWLKTIIIRKSINMFNKKKEQIKTLEKVENIVYKESNNEDHDIYKKYLRQALEGLKKLKEKYRIALTLFYLEGYDYEEMCSILNISYNNCRLIVARGREQLKKHMEQ